MDFVDDSVYSLVKIENSIFTKKSLQDCDLKYLIIKWKKLKMGGGNFKQSHLTTQIHQRFSFWN